MKCVHCHLDSKKKERADGRCPGCGKPFAFDPTAGDPITDMGFHRAIEAVSAGGTVWFGLEHLRYEVARRAARLSFKDAAAAMGLSGVVGVGTAVMLPALPVLPWVLGVGTVVSFLAYRWVRWHPGLFTRERFDGLWEAWRRAHGRPPSLIVRREPRWGSREAAAPEPDVADYSFDRAVICDRARTADLLLANNFHFENNCAVLSEDGYPRSAFATVRAMLQRNPRLEVFVLHDATATGCTLAHRLRTSPDWFKDIGRVTDVGLRPSHAANLRRYWIPSPKAVAVGTPGVTDTEARWLSAHALELACIRPEQIVKRLFRAMNAADGRAAGDGGGGGGDGVAYDSSSFSTEAGADDGGADSFG